MIVKSIQSHIKDDKGIKEKVSDARGGDLGGVAII
jgi:hypothetical protein